MKYIVECDIRTGFVNPGPPVWVQVAPTDGRVMDFESWTDADAFKRECTDTETKLNYRVTEI
jgi:hypothetical protein